MSDVGDAKKEVDWKGAVILIILMLLVSVRPNA